jgi:hypothetical protein
MENEGSKKRKEQTEIMITSDIFKVSKIVDA